MTPEIRDRLFGFQRAWEHPVTLWISIGVPVAIALGGIALVLLHRTGVLSEKGYRDAFSRWKPWIWLSACLLAPVLLGAAWTIAAVTLLSLACYREFARATGLFRQPLISVAAVLGIVVANFAALDHFDRLFFASAPLTVALIAIITIPADDPRGYVQRVGLGGFGFVMFGYSLAYVGLMTTTRDYRPIVLLMFVGICLNDIFAYCTGKLIGGRKLVPTTSPGKTVAGAVGALVLTTALVSGVGHFVFAGTPLDRWHLLVGLGLLISALGQMGDLMLSSIKRDIGIKDIGAVIPGHGGLLDRFDSLVLVAPAVYHYLSLNLGALGGAEPVRIVTGGG